MEITKDVVTVIMQQMKDIIVFALDKQGKHILFSQAHKDTMRLIWNKEIEQGVSIFDVIGTHQDRIKAQRDFDRAINGETFYNIEDYGDEAYSRRFYKNNWSPLYDHDRTIIGILCVCTNITEQVSTQEALKESKEMFRTFFDLTSDGLFYSKLKTPVDWKNAENKDELLMYMLESEHIVHVNQALLDQLGVQREKIIGKSFKQILNYPIENIKRDYRKLLDHDEIALTTSELRNDGSEIWIEGQYITLFNQAGQIVGHFGSRRDITKRVEPEQALQHSHNLMKYIIENDRSAIAVHDRDLRYIYVSQKYLDDYRIQDQDVIGKHHYEVFPDIPQKWRDVHQRVLNGEVISSDEDLFVRLDGTVDYTRWECRPWYLEDHSVGGIIVYTEVINEQKKIEKVLKENEQRLQALFHQAAVGICYGPPNFEFQQVNDKFCDIIGYSKAELKNHSYADMLHPDDVFQNRILKDKLLKKEIDNFTLEMRFIKKDQSIIWANVTLSLIHIDDDAISYVLMIVDDITERKQIEREMRYLNYHDQLTGLYNRRFYEEELRRVDTERNYPISLVIADVNGLKLINDAFGHQQGDRMLVKIAKVFKQECRADEVIARIGGDELVILLPKTKTEEAQLIVDRINRTLRQITINSAPITISVGIGTKTSNDQNIEDVFKQAEAEMYRKKLAYRSETMAHTIQRILDALFEKNNFEKEHAHRVSVMCGIMGGLLGLEKNQVSKLEVAGMMHDIGKINIPEAILNKVSELNENDWSQIMRHSEVGYRILNAVSEFAEISEFVLAHHERWDGRGYPKGLKGEEIPIQSRVIAVADAFDTMRTDKPYRGAEDLEDALRELRLQAGKQFDPRIVQLFIEHKVYEIQRATN